MEFTHVINQMLVLCVPILVGYLAARLGYLDEDLNTKLKRMPEDARSKLQETLQRIINEGSGGLICIIL